jgi:hypothetical protein
MQSDRGGIVQPGRGLGARLMAEASVIAQLSEIAGFPLANVRLSAPLERAAGWRYVAAAEIGAIRLGDGDPIAVALGAAQ